MGDTVENIRSKTHRDPRAWFHTSLDAFFPDFKNKRIKVLFGWGTWLYYWAQGESSNPF